MRRAITGCVLGCLVLAGGLAAQQRRPQDIDLQAAIRTETVDRDLKKAIEMYKAVVDKYGGTDRAVTASALVHMAECYQKLGDAEARRIYEQLLRDFADQKEATTIARARLANTEPAERARGDRPVWTGPLVDLFGQVSPDGRFITFVDWTRSMNLMVHDVVTDTDRSLTNLGSFVDDPGWSFHGQAEHSTFSKDGKQVAYAWLDKAGPAQLRIASMSPNGGVPPRVIYPGSDEIAFLLPFDWSTDGQWIAAAVRRKDGTGQIAIISVTGGALRVLKSVAWKGPERIFFSPDSKYLAYDLPADEVSDQRDVFVMAVDASRDVPAVVHPANDKLMGWSPDGARLIFASDRTGTMGVWSLTFANGKTNATPQLLRADVGSGVSLGLTNAGTLYVFKGVSDRDVRIARIDPGAGRLVGAPTHFVRGFVDGARAPDWSPDGTRLAYQACGGDCIAIRSVATGDVRKFHSLYAREPRWSPDGQSLIAAARDNRGRNGIFRIDAETGATSVVVLGPGFGASPQWAPDGTKIYHRRGPTTIVERDLASGTEREVVSHPLLGPFELSPDGRAFVTRTRVDPATRTRTLLVLPLGGGEPRELLRAEREEGFSNERTTAWTRDGRAVIVMKWTGTRADLWLVPTSGGPPRKLDIDVNSWMEGSSPGGDKGFSLSPDGTQIAFLMGRNAAEVWALENFLPAKSSRP